MQQQLNHLYKMVNMTFADTSNSMVDLVIGINSELNGYFGAFIMLMTFLILLIANKSDISIGFVVSSAVTSLIATLLWAIGVISFGFIFFPLALLFGAIIYYKIGG